MAKIIFHECDNCGSPLKVDANLENAICQYCLSVFKVDRHSAEESPDESEIEAVIQALAAIPGADEHFYITFDHRQLSLTLCGATDSDLKMIAKIKRLESLDLVNTRVTDKGLSYLQGLPRLERLDLSGTGISDAGLSQLASIHTLKYLTLRRTNISERGILKLLSLPDLLLVIDMEKFNMAPILRAGGSRLFTEDASLYLSGQGLDDSDISFLSRCKKLEQLFLDRNMIRGEGLAHLEGLRFLKTLSIDGNPLRKEGLDCILKLKRLIRLEIRNTGIDAEGIDLLKSALPRAKINYENP